MLFIFLVHNINLISEKKKIEKKMNDGRPFARNIVIFFYSLIRSVEVWGEISLKWNPLHFSPFLKLIFSLLLVDLKTKLLLKSPAINEISSVSLFRMRNQSCSTVYIVWRAQLEARLSFVNYSHGKIELATLSISFSMRNIMADYQKCYRFHTYEPKPQCQC